MWSFEEEMLQIDSLVILVEKKMLEIFGHLIYFEL